MQNNIATPYSFLQFVEFAKFNTWDVHKNTYINEYKFENPVLLSEVLSLFREPVSHQKVKESDLRIISKIDFSGNLYLREKNEINNYKGNLFLVPQNSIIYSKINVRHGCIFLNDRKPFVVSNEYPCFIFDAEKVDGDYLILLLRSIPFKKQIDSLKVGIGKARVKIEEFLSLQIPLPSFEIQKSIVEAYQNNLNQADKLEQEATNLENEIEQYLDEKLGIKTTKREFNNNSLSFIDFKDISKWGLDQIFSSKTIYDTKYPTSKIELLCNVGSGGTPSRSRKDYYIGKIPWIKTGEVINDVIYDTEEKITEQAIANSSAKIYPKGSLIIAMYGQGKTRGRTAKLGVDAATNQACAVLSNIKDDVLTDYLWIYLMNEYDRLRELASGNNQPNLNSEMIKNYQVVIPPKDVQKSIISDYQKLKNSQKDKFQQAQQLKKQALLDFENAIFKPAE